MTSRANNKMVATEMWKIQSTLNHVPSRDVPLWEPRYRIAVSIFGCIMCYVNQSFFGFLA